MNRTDFENFRTQLQSSWERLVVIDADSKGKEVEIRKRGALHRRIGGDSFEYVSSLVCRCHWSEAPAWYNGFKFGLQVHRSDPTDNLDDDADVIKRLEALGMYLSFDKKSEEPKFHIIVNSHGPAAWEDGTLSSFVPENTPTYRTSSEIERWLEGRLYGIAERKKKQS